MNLKQNSVAVAAILNESLEQVKAAATKLGFNGLDECKHSIQSNRKEMIIYFDYDAKYFPMGLRFIHPIGGELKFERFSVYEQGLEPTNNLDDALKTWNDIVNE